VLTFVLCGNLQAQTVYLLNLGISTNSTYANNGALKAYSASDTGLAMSGAWFKYTGSGLPSGVTDNVAALTALNSTYWQFVQTDQSTLSVSPGDYVVVRIFPFDSSFPTNSNARFTMIFGAGTGSPNNSSVTLQSPLQTTSGAVRPIIDTDNSSSSNWPTPTGTDNAWTYCAGKIHATGPVDFVFNLGITLAPNGSGTIYGFGRDPQLHVVTT
jgi:hypothetical protein